MLWRDAGCALLFQLNQNIEKLAKPTHTSLESIVVRCRTICRHIFGVRGKRRQKAQQDTLDAKPIPEYTNFKASTWPPKPEHDDTQSILDHERHLKV